MRVRFDGKKFHKTLFTPANTDLGSRCSNKIPWHMYLMLLSKKSKWVYDPKCEIDIGHISNKEMKNKPE